MKKYILWAITLVIAGLFFTSTASGIMYNDENSGVITIPGISNPISDLISKVKPDSDVSSVSTLGEIDFLNKRVSLSVNSNKKGCSWQFSIIQLTDLHIGQASTPIDDYGLPGYDDSYYRYDPVHNRTFYLWDNDTMRVGESAAALMRLVDWIKENKTKYNIKFVVITGDITESAERSEFEKAREILEELDDYGIYWIPVIGNHDMRSFTRGDGAQICDDCIGDRFFRDVFRDHMNELCDILPDWEWGTSHQDFLIDFTDFYSYLQNFVFNYAGYRFYFLDFCSRGKLSNPNDPETKSEAELYDYPSNSGDTHLGTWAWFKYNYERFKYNADDNILIFAHHPMWHGPLVSHYYFDDDEASEIDTYLNDNWYKYYIGYWIAGHSHVLNWLIPLPEAWKIYHWASEVCPIITIIPAGYGWLGIIKVYGKTSEMSPHGVILYKDYNFQNKGELFVGNDANLCCHTIGNDKASSLRIMGGGTAYLYKDYNYEGDKWGGYTLETSISLTSHLTCNDKISSLKFTP